jgi:hypothetical protein
MKIWQEPIGTFQIVRGNSYFSFFVDHDSASWSRKRYQGRRYAKREEAERDLEELRHRAQLRRKT